MLRDVTLEVAAGEHIALLGRTGCGKSTLLQLLTRARRTDGGNILLNGEPLEDYDETTLRRMTTVVSQRVHIFSDTLRENLRLAAPDADDARLSEVLQQVGLGKLLDSDSGLNAAGRRRPAAVRRRTAPSGHRPRAAPSPLLLLDEPTEGLDAETEQQITALLRRHCQGKTLITVTHRLYGTEHLDRICVMDDGRIVEQGDHATLMRRQAAMPAFATVSATAP